MRRSTKKRGALTVVVGSALAAGSLLGGSQANAVSPAMETAIRNAATYTLPTDDPEAVLDGGLLPEVLWKNFQAGVKACMNLKGEVYTPVRYPIILDITVGPDATSGYNIADSIAENYTSPNQVRFGTLSSAAKQSYALALRGTSSTAMFDADAADGVSQLAHGLTAADTGGCESDVRTVLVEPAQDAVFDIISGQATGTLPTLEDSATQVLDGQWAVCMSAGGHSYESRTEPSVELQSLAEDEIRNASDEEIATWREEYEMVVADLDRTCRQTTGLASHIEGDVADDLADFVAANAPLVETAVGNG